MGETLKRSEVVIACRERAERVLAQLPVWVKQYDADGLGVTVQSWELQRVLEGWIVREREVYGTTKTVRRFAALAEHVRYVESPCDEIYDGDV